MARTVYQFQHDVGNVLSAPRKSNQQSLDLWLMRQMLGIVAHSAARVNALEKWAFRGAWLQKSDMKVLKAYETVGCGKNNTKS